MTISVQANLARVKSSLASHDANDTTHDAILEAYSGAFADHDAEESSARKRAHDDYDEGHSRGRVHTMKRRRGEGAGEHDTLRHERSQRDSGSRFRFKAGVVDPLASRPKRRRPKRPWTESAEGVERYAAHPLPRPPEQADWLDPTAVSSSPSPAPQQRQGRRHGEQEQDDDPATARDPDEAFRASLFDALADDEGAAAYWEGVYAQPLHVYARPKIARMGECENGGKDHGDEGGVVLEDMGDDEYAAYVKRKMWERANPHLVREVRLREERARAREEKEEERKKRGSRHGSHGRAAAGGARSGSAADVDDAISRGERRREEKRLRERWSAVWERYIGAWRALNDTVTAGAATIASSIPWPVESGRVDDAADVAQIERFFDSVGRHVLTHLPGVTSTGQQITSTVELKISMLKAERFKWHPDKFLQRFGGLEALGEKNLQLVTGVFQVVDGLLEAERKVS